MRILNYTFTMFGFIFTCFIMIGTVAYAENNNKNQAHNMTQPTKAIHNTAQPGAVHHETSHQSVSQPARQFTHQTNVVPNHNNSHNTPNANNSFHHQNDNRHYNNGQGYEDADFFYPLNEVIPITSTPEEESGTYSTPDANQLPNGTWVAAQNGQVPEGAIVYTNENSTPIYYCQVSYNNQTYYGELVPNDGCYIEIQSTSMHFNQYDVLVQSD